MRRSSDSANAISSGAIGVAAYRVYSWGGVSDMFGLWGLVAIFVG